MKKITILLLFSFTLILCKEKAIEEQLTIPENYQKWKQPAEKILDYTIPGHGASARIIYANSEAYNYTETNINDSVKITYPDGTIIIKEVYNKKESIGKSLPVLDIMIKNSKSADAVNGWLYYMQTPGGKPELIKGRMCVGCHEAANDPHPYFDKNINEDFRDYLFIKPVK